MAYCSAVTLSHQMLLLAQQAKSASRKLAGLATAEKNACLVAMAEALQDSSEAIKRANTLDLEAGAAAGLSSAMLDRLKLDDKRIAAMAKACVRSPRCRIRLGMFWTSAYGRMGSNCRRSARQSESW